MTGRTITGSPITETVVGAGFWNVSQSAFSEGLRLKPQPLLVTIDPLDQASLQRLVHESRLKRTVKGPIDVFSAQETPDYVFFRKSVQQVIVNEIGAFVPRSLFGSHTDIDFEIHRSPDGSVSVNVFSRGSDIANRVHLIAAGNDRSIEMHWLADHKEQYANQWVALAGDKLLSHGDNAREVYREARESGVKLPFVAYVEPIDILPFGGW